MCRVPTSLTCCFVQPRILARTASFCTERSGHFDAFDQGLVFFLPNMTWGQPPFYVHEMITDHWLDGAVNVTGNTDVQTVVSASASLDDNRLVIRIVNIQPVNQVRLQPAHLCCRCVCDSLRSTVAAV